MNLRPRLVAGASLALAMMSGCSTATGSDAPSSATSARESSAPSSGNPLVGTWQTDTLPAAAWVATYRKAGGTAAEAAGFQNQLGDGPGSVNRITLRLSDTDWVAFEQADDQPPVEGWAGTYTMSGTTVRATSSPCQIVYTLTLSGDQMRIHVVSDGPADIPECGPSDLFAQRTVYETAPFRRTA
jgi:hypothetical protein